MECSSGTTTTTAEQNNNKGTIELQICQQYAMAWKYFIFYFFPFCFDLFLLLDSHFHE